MKEATNLLFRDPLITQKKGLSKREVYENSEMKVNPLLHQVKRKS